ncbi:J domain-containing protein [Streptomyces sp. NBC_00286]|uniref:J domain-containing protein n=1 Tax=Streptomyces sp. NBC_00286 TaxID=2975701 RepID=UPI002E2CC58B|nr:J domain-containing protein [Streptomyces sp. NBC_00286]
MMPGQRPRRDHYAVLDVPRDASAGEITSAYRRLVRLLHPDARPADPAAADRLADVLAAYDTLGDPGRRADYDAGRDGHTPRTGAGQPVPVRVTRRPRTSPARPAPKHRAGREVSSRLLGAEDGLFFSASVRIGPRFAVLPPGWDGQGLANQLLHWLRQTDPWLR